MQTSIYPEENQWQAANGTLRVPFISNRSLPHFSALGGHMEHDRVVPGERLKCDAHELPPEDLAARAAVDQRLPQPQQASADVAANRH